MRHRAIIISGRCRSRFIDQWEKEARDVARLVVVPTRHHCEFLLIGTSQFELLWVISK